MRRATRGTDRAGLSEARLRRGPVARADHGIARDRSRPAPTALGHRRGRATRTTVSPEPLRRKTCCAPRSPPARPVSWWTPGGRMGARCSTISRSSGLAALSLRARAAGLLFAVAGSLDPDAISRLGGIADVLGVRGAACRGGRAGAVDAGRVAELRRCVDQGRRSTRWGEHPFALGLRLATLAERDGGPSPMPPELLQPLADPPLRLEVRRHKYCPTWGAFTSEPHESVAPPRAAEEQIRPPPPAALRRAPPFSRRLWSRPCRTAKSPGTSSPRARPVSTRPARRSAPRSSSGSSWRTSPSRTSWPVPAFPAALRRPPRRMRRSWTPPPRGSSPRSSSSGRDGRRVPLVGTLTDLPGPDPSRQCRPGRGTATAGGALLETGARAART